MSKEKKHSRKDKSRPKFDIHSEALKALWAVVFIIFFLLSLLALVGKAGAAGRIFSDISESLIGLGRFIIPFSFLAGSYILFRSRKRNSYMPLIIGGFLFFSGILGLLSLLPILGNINMPGGYWGHYLSLIFVKIFGKIAASIIFLGAIAASFIVSFNLRPGTMIAQRREKMAEKRSMMAESREQEKQKEGEIVADTDKTLKVKTWQDEKRGTDTEADTEQTRKNSASVSRKVSSQFRGETSEENKDFQVKDPEQLAGDFKLPPIELLEKETGKPSSGDIVANANIIKRTLQNFGIEVEMGEVNVGPSVTQFTLKPAEGVKLAKIMALNNDLSLALAAHPIRIEAPIPGRSLVGIEIPNKGFSLVRLKNLLESSELQKVQGNLKLTLGRDVSGSPVIANLAKMPHLLIAGSTGSGKTISLNIIILSLLYQNPPSLLKFILIDPKRVEFPVFSDIPHLLAPVVVDTQKTVNALKWSVSEMERRFELLASVKARDIGAFNSSKKIVDEHGPLPYIVIVIDELADLMASRGKDIEALVVRLAQMARAVGIHLVLATQRPSVEVITGLIKANITSRIAFQVASQVDSRTVLDMSGAEKLLGNGDMLYLSGDASKPRRVQGAYITDKEVRRVADYLREEGIKIKDAEPSESTVSINPEVNISEKMTPLDFEDTTNATDDELYEEAHALVIQAQKASSSLLQRRLRVGYARAARLMDMLEENGVIGPGEGAKPRDVYIGREEEA